MANLEALWVSRQSHPNSTVLASNSAHYTHPRIIGDLDIEFEPIDFDSEGRLSVESLKRRLDRGGVGTVVATIGTTRLDEFDQRYFTVA